MDTPFFTIRMVLIMSFFSTQHMYGMQLLCRWWYGESTQEKQEKKFERFSELPKEIQSLVLEHSVRNSDNKVNLQNVNKQWSEVLSIMHPEIFNLCCNIDEFHMSRIFLNAVYNKNYDGVENILKNSYLNKIESKSLCYPNVEIDESGTSFALDPHDIHTSDKKMMELLLKYKVNMADASTNPTPLMMACLAGSSDLIAYPITDDTDNIRKAVNITIACDHAKCMQRIIDNMKVSNACADLFLHNENRILWGRKFLRRACVHKSLKILSILLDHRFYEINDIFDDNNFTLLDEVLELTKDNDSFDQVIALLKICGAKTAQQIIAKNAAEDEESWSERFPFY